MKKYSKITDNRAWRVVDEIAAMAEENDGQVIFLSIQTYLDKHLVERVFSDCGEEIIRMRRFAPEGMLKYVPIPKPWHLVAVIKRGENLAKLLHACDEYMMFQILIIKRECLDNVLREPGDIFDYNDSELCDAGYFVYGVDFDNNESDTGVMEHVRYETVPKQLTLYFR